MLAVRSVLFFLAASLGTLLIWTEAPLLAQDSATGSIRGTVFDPSGARVPQASIAVVNAGTGATRSPAMPKAASLWNCCRPGITPPALKLGACRPK